MDYVFAASIITFGLLASCNFVFKRYIFRWLFGILLFVGIFLLGVLVTNDYLARVNINFPKGRAIYQAVVDYQPQLKKRSVQVKMRITDIVRNGKATAFDAKAILYFPKDTSVFRLRQGDVLWIATEITPPHDMGNPDSFDYSRYLHLHGIGGIGFVFAHHWQYRGHIEDTSFLDKALHYREKILNLYRSFGWNQDVLGVVSALTVGYKEELSTDIRETYSVAGASHVLALSGLHIGFLYILLLFCLRPLGHSSLMSAIRGVIIILLLWAFAFFTGMSASVVRSVIMFSLFALAEALRRNSFSFNTLAVAAFFMLLYCPSWLFDVGFQMSFFAVASLLLFMPYLMPLYHPRTKLGNYFWQLSCVSVAAQIGAAPLVLYYFSRFSVHFVLTGWVVIPMASLTMYTAMALLLSTPFPIIQNWIAIILQYWVNSLNKFLKWVENLPYASIDGIWTYASEIVLFYTIVVTFLLFLSLRRTRYLFMTLGLSLCLIGIHVYYRFVDMPIDSIEIYNIRSCPAVHCISGSGQSWLVCATQQCDTMDMQRYMNRYWNRLHLNKPMVIAYGVDYRRSPHGNVGCEVRSGIVCYRSVRIGIINDSRWRYQKASKRLTTHYLYLCKGCTETLEELLSIFPTQRVIIDSSLSVWRQQHYAYICRIYHIPYTMISEGSYQIQVAPSL